MCGILLSEYLQKFMFNNICYAEKCTKRCSNTTARTKGRSDTTPALGTFFRVTDINQRKFLCIYQEKFACHNLK